MFRRPLLAIAWLAAAYGPAHALDAGPPRFNVEVSGDCRRLTATDQRSGPDIPLGCLDVTTHQLSMRPATLYLGSAPGQALSFGGPTTGSLSPQFFSNRAAIGKSANAVSLNQFQVDEDQASVTGSSFVNYLSVSGVMTQPTRGGRQGMQVIVSQLVPSAADNENRNYVGGAFGTATYQGDGGTGVSPATGAKGAYFGINPYAVLGCKRAPGASGTKDPGLCARGVLNLSGAEINFAARAGTSVWYKSGIQIAALPDDVVSGSVYDAALSISNQGGVVGRWTDGILFSEANGTYAINPNGWLLRSKAAGLPSFSISARGVIQGDVYGNGGIRPVQASPDGTLSAPANSPPSSSKAACTIGQTAWDPTYEYRCIATNTWKRWARSADTW